MYNPANEKLLRKAEEIKVGVKELLALVLIEKHKKLGSGDLFKYGKFTTIGCATSRMSTLRKKGLVQTTEVTIPAGATWAWPEYELTERGKSFFAE